MKINIKENKDLAVFLICLSISIAIWLSMSLSKSFSRTYTSFLYFENTPIDKKLDNDTISIYTTIEAKGWDLIFKEPIHEFIKIDLNDFSDKKNIAFNNTKGLIQEKFKKIKIINVVPANFNLKFEYLKSKKVAIKLNLEKDFTANYFLKNEPTLIPDSVLISSDEKTLEKINFVETEKINISEKDTLIKNIKLQEIKDVRINKTELDVLFDSQEFIEKEFLVEINIDNNNENVELIIFPEQIQLKCLVPITIYENISASDFYISADFNNIEVQKNNKLLLTVKEQPEGIRNIQLQKDKIEFIIYE